MLLCCSQVAAACICVDLQADATGVALQPAVHCAPARNSVQLIDARNSRRLPSAPPPQIWVYGNSFKSCLVAVVLPAKDALLKEAADKGIAGDFAALCANDAVKKMIVADLTAAGALPLVCFFVVLALVARFECTVNDAVEKMIVADLTAAGRRWRCLVTMGVRNLVTRCVCYSCGIDWFLLQLWCIGCGWLRGCLARQALVVAREACCSPVHACANERAIRGGGG